MRSALEAYPVSEPSEPDDWKTPTVTTLAFILCRYFDYHSAMVAHYYSLVWPFWILLSLTWAQRANRSVFSESLLNTAILEFLEKVILQIKKASRTPTLPIWEFPSRGFNDAIPQIPYLPSHVLRYSTSVLVSMVRVCQCLALAFPNFIKAMDSPARNIQFSGSQSTWILFTKLDFRKEELE